MAEPVLIATILVGIIGITSDILVKLYSNGPSSTVPAYKNRCKWQSSDFLYYCDPKCLQGWDEYHIATPDIINRSRIDWGRTDCRRGGTRRMCCLKVSFIPWSHIADNNWGGTWYSIHTRDEAKGDRCTIEAN
ncbi:hypothetical protein Ddc_21494 [Ditylenchus destructor]|nr:hypothetical protein Ddc_21494 [Ditylenchus destructor]